MEAAMEETRSSVDADSWTRILQVSADPTPYALNPRSSAHAMNLVTVDIALNPQPS